MAENDDPAPPTLYQWAGGDQAFVPLIDCFYDRIEGDELIAPLFPDGVSRPSGPQFPAVQEQNELDRTNACSV